MIFLTYKGVQNITDDDPMWKMFKMSIRGFVESFFFEGIVTDTMYCTLTCCGKQLCQLFTNSCQVKIVFFTIETCGNSFVRRWIGQRGSVEYPPRSPDLTPLDFFLWGTLKNTVYATKSCTLDAMKNAIMTACETIPIETISHVCRSDPQCCRRCIAADEDILNIFHTRTSSPMF